VVKVVVNNFWACESGVFWGDDWRVLRGHGQPKETGNGALLQACWPDGCSSKGGNAWPVPNGEMTDKSKTVCATS